ncbi:MAG TPA: histidine kinase dimerization/phospho-acceptor domain-containing protein, partial [Isosphaeraceae bacterium]|nr:histidine kinase dimerization/phospho-acceptor domain-containing protein [Isosphaeraceae bacterium]
MANLVSSTIANAPSTTPTPRGGSERRDSAGADAAGPHAPAAPHAVDEEPDGAERLRAQYAEISQLAGGLAHEIKNPLSTVSLNLDLLAEDFQNPETPRDRRVLQRVERLRHEIHRLSGILENFLRFARIQELKLEVIDLNAVLEELHDFYEPHAATKSIVLRTRLAPE